MLEKLKNISKIIFLVATVFYIFGFITISSFWGRFGIITFDIVNARFLIAGFFCVVSIIVCLLLAWVVYKRAPFKDFFNTEKWRDRFLGFFGIWGLLYSAGAVLTSLLNLGSYQPPAVETSLKFSNVTGFDYIGIFIKNHINLGNGGYDYVIKVTLEMFSYIFLVFLLITACVIIHGWFPKKDKKSLVSVDQASPEIVTEKAQDILVTDKKPLNKYLLLLMVNVEILAICGFISLYIFCISKVGTAFIDFSTIQNEPKLTATLYFSWLYVLVMTTYVFLNISFKNDSFSNFNLFKKIENITNYDDLIRQIIIPIFSAAVVFGWTIYPRIPFAFGGGQPRLIQLQLTTPLNVSSTSKVYLLGESSQFVFVAIVNKINSEALEINKNQIEYIQTKTLSVTSAK